MEGDESGLSSYFHHNHHHHHQQQHHHNTTGTSNTNGLFSNPHHHNNHHHHQHHQQQQHNQSSIGGGGGGGGGAHFSSEPTPLIFPQHSSVTGRAPVASSTPPPPPPETIRRKRGRPRKYGTSLETPPSATASTASAKKLSTSTTTTTTTTTSPSPSLPLSSPPRKKEPSSSTVSSPTSSKKAQLLALGNAGQGFTPHVITVAAGEDVAQKIMSFVQQRKRAVCILSASGSISNASLRQPATLGGNVTYEGRFEILSLSGSFLHSEMGGASSRTGGLSVCLSGTDGRIVGGGVGGPLKAAGPVQVIAGSFVFDAKKEANIDFKGETSASKLPPSIGGATVSSSGFRTTTSVRGNDDHQHMGGSSFMLQSRGMHPMPTRQNDWRSALDGTDLGACRSPEDGDDEHLRD